MFEWLGCFFNPVQCVTSTLQSIPQWWWVAGAFLLGTVFGALFRGVAVAIVVFFLGFFIVQQASEKPKPQQLDLFPEQPTQKVQRPHRKTIRDLFPKLRKRDP